MSARRPPTRHPSQTTSAASDAFVLVAMALVVAAIVVGLHLHAQFPLGMAGLVGASLFLALAGFKAWQHGVAEREALARELERLAREDGTHRQEDRVQPPRPPSRPEEMMHPTAVSRPAPHPVMEPPHPGPLAHVAPADVEGGYVADLSPPDLDVYPPESIDSIDLLEQPEEPPATQGVSEDDVELLQQRIKDMLAKVTAAEKARPAGSGMANADEDPGVTPAAAMGIEASLDALKSASRTMRGTSADFARSGAPGVHNDAMTSTQRGIALPPADSAPPVPAEPVDHEKNDQISKVAAAISEGRVDVMLEPILLLGNQATQHYEVSIRVRGKDGEDLGASQTTEELAGRGLLPLFDAARVVRSAVISERLAAKGKAGSVFTHANGESLTAPSFSIDVQQAVAANRAGARQLVLTFQQSDIRSFRLAEQRAVAALAALGFRFAIGGLTDLDMNFEAMARAGFGFVKLDARVLTEGLPHPGGLIPASDVCQNLAAQGFAVIVEGIDSEDVLARVFGFGVILGQGVLFGGPRSVRADVVARRDQAAA